MKKKKKKKIKKKFRKKIKKKIPKIRLKKKKGLTANKKRKRKEQSLQKAVRFKIRPLIKAYGSFREKRTIKRLKEEAKQLKENNPKSIKVATLLFKPDTYNFDMKIDWIGFNIKNKFIVGYGLDYNELYRNKKSIYKLNEE